MLKITLYSIGNTIETVKKSLSNNFRTIENWFHGNLMVLNMKKCHYTSFGIVSENDELIFDEIKLLNSCEGKILGVINDNELIFDPHVGSMCKKATQKLGVLNRISLLLEPEKKKIVFNAVMKSHFSYCPLIWMFSSRRCNNLINRIPERSQEQFIMIQLAHFNNFCNVIEVSVFTKNVQTLTAEVFKVMNNICPPIMKTFSDFRETGTTSDNSKKWDRKK